MNKCNSPEFITGFINIYKKHISLWKVKDKSYNNKEAKEEGYRDVLEYYRKYDPSATKDYVLRKINNLRSAFRKEYKKVVSVNKTGSHPYIPKLWYYDLLLFTADQKTPRDKKKENDESSDESDEEAYSQLETLEPDHSYIMTTEDPSIIEEHPRPSSRLSDNSDSDPPSKRLSNWKDSIIEETYKNLTRPKDEFDAIGISIGCKLRRMNENQKIIAEHLCNTVLYYGLQNKLHESSYICCLPPASEEGIIEIENRQIETKYRI